MREELFLGCCFTDWRGLAQVDTPFPSPPPIPLPASQLLHRRIRRPHLPLPSSSSSTPPYCPLCASPLRRSHTQTHSAFFFKFPHPPPPPPSPPWIWVCGSGSDSTSQNHPPDPTSPTLLCYRSGLGVDNGQCMCGGPPAGLSNMSQRDFSVGRVALLKLLNAGFAPHGCGRES